MARKAKRKPETESSKAQKGSKTGNVNSASYSFTEPVVRVSKTAGKKTGPRHTIKPSQDAGTKTQHLVFYKRADKSSEADIVGKRDVTMWRKSAGRHKSWGHCIRLKVTQDDLEVLAYRKPHPVSFGWRFSTTNVPFSFVRSHGLRVNKQLKPRKKRMSKLPNTKDLDGEYSRDWPLPMGYPHKILRRRQEILRRNEVAALSLPERFARLTISSETVNISSEVFLNAIKLPIRPLQHVSNEARPNAIVFENLVVSSFLRNDSHADVYCAHNPKNPSKRYHAYAFLSEGLSKNWPAFVRRKMDRLRRSNDFYAETVQLGRKIIVMKAESKPNEVFQMKGMELEFPPLPGTERKPRRTPKKENKRSYAAVVIGKKLKHHVNSNHRAYKAWEDRNLTRNGRPKKHNKSVKHDTKSSLQEKKLEVLTPVPEHILYQKKIPNIPVVNRFAVLSN